MRLHAFLICALLAVASTALPAQTASATRLSAVAPDSAAGQQLVQRLRAGGLVLFFRHADTRGEPCDRSFRVGDRTGQRKLSLAGRQQAARIGPALQALGIPVEQPVLAARSSARATPPISPSVPGRCR